MHTFFDAANIALNQFSKGKSSISSHEANDGNLATCFVAFEVESWWHLELGADVRVSMVFILHYGHMTLHGFGIFVGKCILSNVPISSVYYSLVRYSTLV